MRLLRSYNYKSEKRKIFCKLLAFSYSFSFCALMKILVINGPNLNKLGTRDPKHYGAKTLDEINEMLQNEVQKRAKSKIRLKFFQSNHEGDLIDFIQQECRAEGLLINPGALAHYSIALADALRDFPGLKVEVHLSDIRKREKYRRISATAEACDAVMLGEKEQSYVKGLQWLMEQLQKSKVRIQNAK